jgi:Type II secretion system (T2SS), protein M subtype b
MISARDRRTATIGVTVIGTLVGLARGVPALVKWERDRAAEAVEMVAQASSARAGVRALPLLRDSLRARQLRLSAIDSVLLSGASASAAAADLAATLDDMATESRLKITAMQLRADSAGPGALTTVAVRVNGATDVAGLAAFLRSVESGETPLVVRGVAVTQTEPMAQESRVEALRVDILVEGVARVTPAKRP